LTLAEINQAPLEMLVRQALVQPTKTGELTAWAFDAKNSGEVGLWNARAGLMTIPRFS
jgi:hypothetical protein